MMKNTVTAKLEFYYKGVKHSPSAVLDLDQLLEKNNKLPSIHNLLANANGIDNYSYEYEVMLQEKISYESPCGLISDFIIDGALDIEAFEKKWQALKIYKSLQAIVQKHLDIEVLEQHPDLINALYEAYRQGQNQSDI